MFYLLLFTGISLIVMGIYLDKNIVYDLIIEKQLHLDDKYITFADIQEISDLKLRIKNLENTVFSISKPDEYVEIAPKLYNIEGKNNTSTNLLETFDMLSQYEDEKKSLEEICLLLNMKKGEVLLLKNLHKNYQS